MTGKSGHLSIGELNRIVGMGQLLPWSVLCRKCGVLNIWFASHEAFGIGRVACLGYGMLVCDTCSCWCVTPVVVGVYFDRHWLALSPVWRCTVVLSRQQTCLLHTVLVGRNMAGLSTMVTVFSRVSFTVAFIILAFHLLRYFTSRYAVMIASNGLTTMSVVYEYLIVYTHIYMCIGTYITLKNSTG